MDYDRFNNSLTKLRDKKEKSLNDEKNLFKVSTTYHTPLLVLTCLCRSNKTLRLHRTSMIISTQP